MPHVELGALEHTGGPLNDVEKGDMKYTYPTGLDLRPNSKLHKKIQSKVLQRAQHSATMMQDRYPAWREIDRVLTAYIDLSDEEQAIKADDARKPVSIIIPESYAVLETLLSYLVAAYYQDPIFRYEGHSPEDVIGAIMLEKVNDLHCHRSKVLLGLHTHFRDGLSYGFGVGAPGWAVERGWNTVRKTESVYDRLKNTLIKQGYLRGREKAILFEGNELNNIDPYLALPDVNVPVQNVQKGEYFGWIEKTNYLDLLSAEQDDPDLFNVRYLEKMQNRRSAIQPTNQSGRDDRNRTGVVKDTSSYTKPTDLIHLIIKIIPKEWEVADIEVPEKWHFTLGGDTVLLRAKPLGLNHDRFPIIVNSPDFDGYSTTPISRMEMLYGMQGVLDWLFNAHIANVRKAVNDMIVYDPYWLSSADVENPEPGKHIRVRRPAWGRGVKDSIMQLAITDITKQHIADSGVIVNYIHKVGASDEAAMGSLRQGGPERLTKSEFQGTRRSGITRLERIGKIVGCQSIQDLGYFFAHHTQQLMTQEQYVKTTGRWEQTLMDEYAAKVKKGRMKVTPYDLLINYDLKVRDGSVPDGNYSEVWLRMFESLTKDPELRQEFDTVRIFKHIARNAGAKNVDDFVRVKKVSNEQAVNEVDKGNLITLDQAEGLRNG